MGIKLISLAIVSALTLPGPVIAGTGAPPCETCSSEATSGPMDSKIRTRLEKVLRTIAPKSVACE